MNIKIRKRGKKESSTQGYSHEDRVQHCYRNLPDNSRKREHDATEDAKHVLFPIDPKHPMLTTNSTRTHDRIRDIQLEFWNYYLTEKKKNSTRLNFEFSNLLFAFLLLVILQNYMYIEWKE